MDGLIGYSEHMFLVTLAIRIHFQKDTQLTPLPALLNALPSEGDSTYFDMKSVCPTCPYLAHLTLFNLRPCLVNH